MPQSAPANATTTRHRLGTPPDSPSLAGSQDFARRVVRAFARHCDSVAQWRGLTLAFGAVEPVTINLLDTILPPLAIRCAALLNPQHLTALVAADPAIAALLVERCYGGTPAPPRVVGKRRTATGDAERHEGGALIDIILSACGDAADPLAGFSATRIPAFDDADATARLDAGHPLLHFAFTLHLPASDTGYPVSLVLPAALFRAVGGPPAAAADTAAALLWRRQLRQRSGDVLLAVRSVIARPTLSLAQLMALRPGDVIPIKCPRNVPLLVADRHFASGTIGERDGRVAFCIAQLEPEPNP